MTDSSTSLCTDTTDTTVEADMPTTKSTRTTTTYKLNSRSSCSAIPNSKVFGSKLPSPKFSMPKLPFSRPDVPPNPPKPASPPSPQCQKQSPKQSSKPSPKNKCVSFSAEIPRILSRIETLQIVFDRAPSTFRLFDIALYRLEETIHQLSTMLLALDPEQRQRMDVQGWLEEALRLLDLTRDMVNDTFERNGKITRTWKRMLRVKIEGGWWDNHRTVDLTMAILEHCVKLSRRYERLVYDLLRAQGEED